MMEVLSTAPDIISIGQEHVPERLKGKTLIFYMKERDRVILAGWKENTATLTKVIMKYLELPPCVQEGITDEMRGMGLHGTAMEILEALGRIYQVRRGRKKNFKRG